MRFERVRDRGNAKHFRGLSSQIYIYSYRIENYEGNRYMTDNYYFKSPIGNLIICEENHKITRIYLQAKEEDITPGGANHLHSDLLYEAYKQLQEYFSGKRKTFDLPINPQGTPFQQKVWSALQDIPFGETRIYEDIAIAIGNKKALRAVGQANNRNPILIVVPCHRVINKNGQLGGFGCGIETKKILLDLENSCSRPC